MAHYVVATCTQQLSNAKLYLPSGWLRVVFNPMTCSKWQDISVARTMLITRVRTLLQKETEHHTMLPAHPNVLHLYTHARAHTPVIFL